MEAKFKQKTKIHQQNGTTGVKRINPTPIETSNKKIKLSHQQQNGKKKKKFKHENRIETITPTAATNLEKERRRLPVFKCRDR